MRGLLIIMTVGACGGDEGTLVSVSTGGPATQITLPAEPDPVDTTGPSTTGTSLPTRSFTTTSSPPATTQPSTTTTTEAPSTTVSPPSSTTTTEARPLPTTTTTAPSTTLPPPPPTTQPLPSTTQPLPSTTRPPTTTQPLPSTTSTTGGIEVDGVAVFAYNCSTCHYDSGEGGTGADLSVSTLDTDAIRVVIVEGRGRFMPAWGALLDPAEIEAVTRYVKGLQQ